MADLNGKRGIRSDSARLLPVNDTVRTCPHAAQSSGGGDLTPLVEWLFFAYRDFTGEADAMLAERGFGRAHHRMLHFVSRHPGLRVVDLLDILKITKQSLARVLKTLVDEGYVEQRPGLSDRRERHLYATETGEALARELRAHQQEQMLAALQAAGPGAREAIDRFLAALVSDARRGDVERLIAAGTSRAVDEDAASLDKLLGAGRVESPDGT